MNDEQQDPYATAGGSFISNARIIAAALMTGIGLFLMVAIMVRFSGHKGLFAADPWSLMPPTGMTSLVAMFTAAMMVVCSFVIPPSIVATARKRVALNQGPKSTVVNLFDAVYVQQIIIGMGLLQGGAFFNGIAFMVEGLIPNLIAALVLLVLIAMRFPSPSRIAAFSEDQAALVMEARQSA